MFCDGWRCVVVRAARPPRIATAASARRSVSTTSASKTTTISAQGLPHGEPSCAWTTPGRGRAVSAAASSLKRTTLRTGRAHTTRVSTAAFTGVETAWYPSLKRKE